ncbi:MULTISPECIES: ABC transporter ATP-binding protein [unclassified Fibrobacter]|uniref:ABC transporter ATP-binding protein n=1 Tax=unclassified Fibrobacter TaxID=2634177 RepID=UPI000D796E2F|nr:MULTISPECIES: ABC transporter ATP-binding protein [unclassified Fibrobacter]PWJ68571.1 peptide/nickel transport system ATP-binding protein [Fibrobacter sp. UWR4]PZW72037.1 peptide/nickel transport system ATP-binding protein [Fibrobacter sp. UWR1]
MSKMHRVMNVAPVLSVRNLSVAFGFSKGKKGTFVCKEGSPLQVTDGVSFDIHKGEFFALVGESGCGKSVTAMSILRLLPQPSAQIVSGEVFFNRSVIQSGSSSEEDSSAVDLVKLSIAELQKIRGSEIACIFQEPMQALNPVLPIKKQLLEVFKYNSSASKISGDALATIREQLKAAGFTDPDRVLDSYPHELSGGMLQRVCIVMALLANPKLIIADEPTTALDVTVQAQVLAVLKEMASRSGTAVLLITHNMGIVSQYADRVAVMYAGRIVEKGAVDDVINEPFHPYTRGLLAAIPESHSQMKNLKSIPGSVPHPRDFVSGCRFADRCECCMQSNPELQAKCRSAELPPKSDKCGHCAFCFASLTDVGAGN